MPRGRLRRRVKRAAVGFWASAPTGLVAGLVVVGGLGIGLAAGPARAQDPAAAAPGQAAPPVPAPATPTVPGLETITTDELGAHVRTLAADEMKGRDARSGGIELAADYVRDQMKGMGLAPAGTGGDYFHVFTLGRIEREPEATRLDAGETSLAAADGWLALAPCNGTWAGPLVFAGDGGDDAWKRAPGGEQALAGAWLVIQSARPLVHPDTAAWLAGQAKRAGALGASGVIHVPESDSPARQWRFIAGFLGRARHGTAADIATPPQPVALWCERAALDRLMGPEVAAALLAREPFAAEPPAEPPVTVTLAAKATLADAVAYKNVVGRVPGTDSTLSPEHVAFSAHYDHIGMRAVPEGADGIFNGADDDASGVAAILEMAQAFAQARPKRSVLVIAFTAEEQGLLGSKHWVAAPTVPLPAIVADFNIEMIGRHAANGPGHLWITGYERSTLGALVAEAAKPHGVTAEPDPYPAMGFFMRSDNYSFARHGIPAHSLSSYDPEHHHDYHRPGDHAEKCDFANMQTLVRGIYAAARRMADGDATPRWTEGDPLGAARRR